MPIGRLIALFLASMQYRKINQWRPVAEVWKLLNAILANTVFCSFFEIDFSFKHIISSFSVKHTGSKFIGRICPSVFSLRHWKKFKPTVFFKSLSLSSINQKTNNFVSNMWQQETHALNNTSLTIFLYCFANIPF